jgi:hypothetical protein
MAEHPDAELLRQGYDAFSRGDLETVGALFDDAIEWHVTGGPLVGTYKGTQQVFGFFGQLFERSGGTFRLEIHDMLANDEHVVVLLRERAEREGRVLDANAVHVWHIRERKAAEFWGIPADVDAFDRFWS